MKTRILLKTIFFLLTSILYVRAANAQNVNIPDANFKKALVENNLINKNGDGEIQVSEAEAFSGEINIIEKEIADLTGIEVFTNITSLVCYKNKLSFLDLSKNKELTSLDCSDNPLGILDIRYNSKLKYLVCHHNNLSSLILSENIVLEQVYCAQNKITTLDISKNTALFTLDCKGNSLTGLNLSNGNNGKITTMEVTGNDGLSCIQIDTGFTPHGGWTKDPSANYSDNCGIVYIPDANFKKALVENKSINTSGDGEIQVSEAEAFSGEIDVSNKGITDLTGIEAFTQLTKLFCYGNKLTFLDISRNTKLEQLDVGYNQLTSLDISKNLVLKELFCDNNTFTSLDVFKNTLLKTLVCNESKLTSLDVSENTALEGLAIGLNLLTSLDISKNTELKELDCKGNQLTLLDISKNTKLKFLYCIDNNLTHLNLNNGNNGNLEILHATGNPDLSCIQIEKDFTPPVEWEKDAIANYSDDCGAPIVNIPDANFKKALVENTNINTNGDGEIQVSEAEAFSGHLDVSDKEISDLTGIEAFTGIQYYSGSNNNLTEIDLSNNTLLKKVGFANNQITDAKLPGGLDELNGINNKLTELDVSNVGALERLILSGNPLTALKVPSGNTLAYLEVEDCKLQSLDLSKSTGLEIIRLASNELTALDVSKNTGIEWLYCHNNKLSQLNVANGNNAGITQFKVTNNSGLSCIQIEKGFTPPSEWEKDATANYSDDCGAPIVNIPDANFKKALVENTNINTNGDGEIQVSEAEAFSDHLDVSDKGISDLTGLEAFTAIQYFSASNNKLKKIDLSKHTLLKKAGVGNNQITEVKLSGSLDEFTCPNNMLTELNLTDFEGLERLNCSDNLLTSIAVPKEIIYLWIGNNKLTQLDLAQNTSLLQLKAANNQLTYLNLANGNNGAMIDVEIAQNANLNCIQIDKGFNPSEVWKKDASANYSDDCGAPIVNIPDANFKKVLVENTNINTNGDGEIQVSEAEAFSDHLDVSDKGISDLTGLEAFTGIQYFSASNNKLKKVDLSKHTLLKKAGVGNNQITEVKLSGSLDEFTCPNNMLTELNLTDFEGLERLNCSDNLLTSIAVPKEIIYLWIGNNKLTQLDLAQNTSLLQLKAANNQLTYLNLANGNNGAMIDVEIAQNANLNCIQIDKGFNPSEVWKKDASANYSDDCGAPIVNIPDANFKKALVEDSNINTNGDGEIQVSEAEGFDGNLFVDNKNIADVKGIEAFTFLKVFHCNNNKLTSIDISKNNDLEVLKCEGNQITKLVLTKNSDFDWLYCGNNQLTSLDLTGIFLGVLSCEGNKITNLDLAKIPGLDVVNCSNNNLNYLNLPKLSKLDATNNPELKCIQIEKGFNPPAEWEKDAIANYSEDCSVVPEPIVNIPDANFKMALVENTNINTNGDGEIQVSEAEAFSDHLDVSDQGIADLTGIETFTAIQFFTTSNNKLKKLDLSKNTALKKVGFAGNQISELILPEGLDELTGSNNLITTLDASGLSALERLNLTGNQLISLKLPIGNTLTYLEIEDNKLPSLDIAQNTGLIQMKVGSNQLKAIDVSQNNGLKWLYFQGNNLEELDLSNNSSLQEVDLSQNNLTLLNIANGTNTTIEKLDITGNVNLNCVQIDEGFVPGKTWVADVTSNFSSDCNVTTGIKEQIAQSIKMYPNPAKNKVFFIAEDRQLVINRTSVLDLSGRVIEENQSVVRESGSIDISALQKGMYLLLINTNKGISLQRFIKE